MIISSQTGLKRKHRSSFSSDDKDSVITIHPPSAKRQQLEGNSSDSKDAVLRTRAYTSSITECDSSTTEQKKAATYSHKKEYMKYSPKVFKKNANVTNNIDTSRCNENVENGETNTVENSEQSNCSCLCDGSALTNHRRCTTTGPNNVFSNQYGAQFSEESKKDKSCGKSSNTWARNKTTNCITSQSDNTNYLKSDQITPPQYVNCMTPVAESETMRQCPLPALAWANAHDVWQQMCKRDDTASCTRNASMLDKHPGLQPRMRSILLDWLIEVCEVYKLHRETYYLAVDYLDRYLTVQEKVQKTHLQLIGITCLFIAAKVEEIYPPKIGEFAYVTDGACQEIDILHHEILLLQALDWNISPVTPMGWLGVYMQLHVTNNSASTLQETQHSLQYHNKNLKNDKCSTLDTSRKCSSNENPDVDESFIYPQFSSWEFCQTAKLLDLCSLDLAFADFSYSVIAAAAMSYTFNKEIAVKCSGLTWHKIEPCVKWMEPFFFVICSEASHMQLSEQNEQVNSSFGLSHICPKITSDDSHIIQNHSISLSLFERAELHKHHTEMSPAAAILPSPEGLLTPPASSRKSLNPTTDHKESARPNVLKIRVIATSSPGVSLE